MRTYQQRMVDGLQLVDAKQEVREEIVDICKDHISQAGHQITVFLGLPASKCIFENMFSKMCKGMGWETIIRCVEKDKKIRKEMMKNMPKEGVFCGLNFDKIVEQNQAVEDIIWADYCGNYAKRTDTGLSYPHINTFARFAARKVSSGYKGLYFMTFSMNGRGIGKYGVGDLVRVIRIALNNHKVSDKVIEVYRHTYDGGKTGVSKMITIGFAINYEPYYQSVVKLEATSCHDKKGRYIPKLKKEKVGKIAERKNFKREAIKVLLGAGWESEGICKAFMMKPMKVAGIRASLTKEKMKISGQSKEVVVAS